MIIKFKIFESYNDYSSAIKELIGELGYDFVEEYFDEHLKNTDFYDIISLYPSIIWNHINDKDAMDAIIEDEINAWSIDDIDEDKIKEYIIDESDDEDREKIINYYIENEIDLDELKDLKKDFKEETDENDKKIIRKQIKEIQNKIKEIKGMDLDEILDEMSESDIRDIASKFFNEYDCIETIIKDRYDNYDLKDYIEEIYGDPDKIEFGRRGDMDWILNYVDESAVIEEYNDNESYEYKEERVQEEIGNSYELQEEILRKDPKNAILLFDVFANNTWKNGNTIEDDYNFQKAYIEAYAENYAEDGTAEDLEEGKAKAIQKLYKNFSLDYTIEEEYDDYMYLVYGEKYNL